MSNYTAQERAAVDYALGVVLGKLRQPGEPISSPGAVRDYLRLRLADLPREEFHVLYLNSQLGMIEARREFVGTLTQTSVYPREIVKAALELNAAAVVLAHNHPSGNVEPSRADELLTATLKGALALVDVRVLDHVIVAGGASLSFVERGLI